MNTQERDIYLHVVAVRNAMGSDWLERVRDAVEWKQQRQTEEFYQMVARDEAELMKREDDAEMARRRKQESQQEADEARVARVKDSLKKRREAREVARVARVRASVQKRREERTRTSGMHEDTQEKLLCTLHYELSGVTEVDDDAIAGTILDSASEGAESWIATQVQEEAKDAEKARLQLQF